MTLSIIVIPSVTLPSSPSLLIPLITLYSPLFSSTPLIISHLILVSFQQLSSLLPSILSFFFSFPHLNSLFIFHWFIAFRSGSPFPPSPSLPLPCSLYLLLQSLPLLNRWASVNDRLNDHFQWTSAHPHFNAFKLYLLKNYERFSNR